jgi:hypothetical protein
MEKGGERDQGRDHAMLSVLSPGSVKIKKNAIVDALLKIGTTL